MSSASDNSNTFLRLTLKKDIVDPCTHQENNMNFPHALVSREQEDISLVWVATLHCITTQLHLHHKQTDASCKHR